MTGINRPELNAKLTIKLIELPIPPIEAYYNPKEISIDKSVPWNKHKKSRGDAPILEFTDAEPKSMSFELFFDTYESGKNVHTEYIAKLEKATLVMGGSDESKKRPPTCLVTWGQGFPKFVGVMESLSVKYTMFFSDGTPCRATASIKMKQASRATAKGDKDVPTNDQGSGGGSGGGSDRRAGRGDPTGGS